MGTAASAADQANGVEELGKASAEEMKAWVSSLGADDQAKLVAALNQTPQSGKVVVIGANRGIGLALVKELVGTGSVDVVATSRKPDEALASIGGKCIVVDGVDICQGDSLDPLKEACAPGIKTLIINAGLLEAAADTKKLADMTEDDFQAFTKEFAVNCLGVLRVVSALHGCLQLDSRVILLGTTLSSFEQKDGGLYGYRATKAALHMVGQNLAIELKGKSSVAVIHPGFVETGMTSPLGFKAGEGGIIDTTSSARGILQRVAELSAANSGMSCDYSGKAFSMGGPKHTVAEKATDKAEGATVVIGGNRGIGLELVRQLHSRKDTVIATTRNAEPKLSEIGVTVVEGVDICKGETLTGLAAACEKGIAALVVNAGLLEAGSDTKKLPDMTESDLEAFSREWEVNCLGALRVVSVLSKHLAQNAKVVLLGTTLSSFDQKDGGLYGYRSTKAALHMVGLNLSIDLKDKASVAVVHPGFVETDMTGPLGFKAGAGGIIDTATSAEGIIARIDGLHPERSGVACDHAGEFFAW